MVTCAFGLAIAVFPAALLGAKKERGVLVVVEPDAAARAKPAENAAIVKNLAVVTEIKRRAQKGRWLKVSFEGGDGWVSREHVAAKGNAAAVLYDRGVRNLQTDDFAKATVLLDAAARLAPTDRRPLVALLLAHEGAGKKREADDVKARLRAFDRWLHGVWCDGGERAFVVFWPSGEYYFRLERISTLANRGRYQMREADVALIDETNVARNTMLKIVKREVGVVLIDRSGHEYLKVLCRGNETVE